jgi:hypothetical protein
VTELLLLDADELDYAAFVALQKHAFRELLAKAKADDSFMTPEYFGWKFRPPARNGRIAVVRDGDRYVAANAMMPFTLTKAGTTLTGWQSCDTATAPEARGKGHFLRCLNLLRQSMSADDLFYGFPNQSSAPGFAKVGWRPKRLVTTWINPVPLASAKSSKEIIQIAELDARQEELSRRLAARPRVMVQRSADYLTWRYLRHPLVDYTIFGLTDGDHFRGTAVVRVAEVLGRKMALVMDLWGTDAAAERSLLRHAAAWAVKQGVRIVAAFDTGLSLAVGLGSGFVPVPPRLLPKRQVLMGQPMSGRAAEAFMEADWRVQMGDWDVF